ncbi:hypothetical protein [Roseinatronobacter sp. NSM]|uniref:hypothetical protein n=1 Tax=Roseinatronobacter sp. NSM TaxID=3457785 RepID=UPI004036E89A
MPDHQLNSDRQALPRALGKVEKTLHTRYPGLNFFLVGQAHYGEEGFAFIEVNNLEDQALRDLIRKEAGDQLCNLGFPVELIQGKDVYHIKPMH